MLISKEVLAPGTYFARNKSGVAIPRHITAAKIKHFCDAGRQMLRAGLTVPVPLNHQPLKPFYLASPDTSLSDAARKITHNAGYVKNWRLDKGKLYADIDIPDEELAKKIGNEIKFVSPELDPSFVDGKGKRWDDVITHVALVTRPVWAEQEPFVKADPKDLPKILSDRINSDLTKLREPVDWETEPLAASLALDGRLVRSEAHGWKPADPARFSMAWFAMPAGLKPKKKGMDDDADEDDEEGGGDDDGVTLETGDDEDEDESDEDEGGDKPDSPLGGEGPVDAKSFETLMMMLEKFGLHLPKDTNEKNFVERLNTAIHALLGAQPKAPGTQMPDAKEEKPGMLMSLDQITDPVAKATLLNSWGKLRASRDQRINRLRSQGRITKDRADELLKQSGAVQLSINGDTGEFGQTEVDRTVALLEEVTPRPQLTESWLSTHTTEEPHPSPEMTRDRAKAIADEQCKNSGIK